MTPSLRKSRRAHAGATLTQYFEHRVGRICTVASVRSSELRAGNTIMRFLTSKTRLLALICLIAAPHAWGGTMRCGNTLIVNGESMAAVKAFCGSPTVVQRSIKVKAATVRVGGRTGNRSHTVGAEVPVQTWTYNRGPNKLMKSVRFVDGEVVAIKTLQEYGY